MDLKNMLSYLVYQTEIRSNAKSVGSIKNLIRDQLTLSDYTQNMNVNPENTRFVLGIANQKKCIK